MSTVDELKAYLAKRGYDVDVTKSDGNTYLVSVTSKKVEDIVSLIATIHEPGRFIVSVKLDDIIPFIGDILGIVKLSKRIDDLEESMSRNTENLTRTDDKFKEHIMDSANNLNDSINDISKTVDGITDDMGYIKKQPWWKRFLGVK
jgi:hypothetical protein